MPDATWEQNLERFKAAGEVVIEMQQQQQAQHLEFLANVSEMILAHRERLADIVRQADDDTDLAGGGTTGGP
jgi:hypothetical protein